MEGHDRHDRLRLQQTRQLMMMMMNTVRDVANQKSARWNNVEQSNYSCADRLLRGV